MSQVNFQTITSEEKFSSIELKDGLLSVVDTLLGDVTLSEAERSSLAAIRSKIAITL